MLATIRQLPARRAATMKIWRARESRARIDGKRIILLLILSMGMEAHRLGDLSSVGNEDRARTLLILDRNIWTLEHIMGMHLCNDNPVRKCDRNARSV